MRRAVGIIRVSERGEREGPSFRSPSEQRERIEVACERDGLALVAIHDEIDVKGGAQIADRPGLAQALAAIEGGEAEVLTVAYFDRLFRSLRVQDEVVSRVEAAGGRVLALDFGEVTGRTAAQWLSSTMLGAMSEYYRRSVGERVAGSQAQAVAKGVWPSRVPVGYARGPDGVLCPSSDAPVVAAAFTVRAEGASLREVRAFLRENGVERTYAAVDRMLRSRAYLGEIHFGALMNESAHPPLVDVDTWRKAQRTRVPRGEQTKSSRLLARLGILRCATCNSRMTVGGRPRYPCYRCREPDCPAGTSIMAHLAESAVVNAVLERFGSATGRASAEHGARQAAEAAERAQADLDSAIRAFGGVADEPAAWERLAELREIRDRAVERANHLRSLHATTALELAADWDRLTLDERRAVIRAGVESVRVAPGRGADRLSISLRE